MKKTILLAALVLLGTAGVSAQDTLFSSRPKNTYFYNNWIDSVQVGVGSYPEFQTGILTGKYFYTKDSLTVYGVAVSLFPYSRFAGNFRYLEDTSLDRCYEYVGLLQIDADTFRWISDTLLVHLRDDTATYYFDLDMPDINTYDTNEPQAVYERYFDSPVRVADSFYVGITRQSWDPEYIYIDSTDYWEILRDTHRKVMLTSFIPNGGIDSNLRSERIVHKVFWKDRIQYFYDTSYHVHFYAFMFPIMVSPYSDTADADTTVVDTTGIASPQLLERYVSVVPNPAADKAQVLSSFGLREVEVYDAAGTRVLLRRRLTGYTADLDVSALPAGAYLVRVTTLSGTVTKKLVVQRR